MWGTNKLVHINLRPKAEHGVRVIKAARRNVQGYTLVSTYSCCERTDPVGQDRWYFPKRTIRIHHNSLFHYARESSDFLSVGAIYITSVYTLMLPLSCSDPLQSPDVGPQDGCYGGRGHC